MEDINEHLGKATIKILGILNKITDTDAVYALLLAEIRMIYKNNDILEKVIEIKEKFVEVHNSLEDSILNDAVK